VAAWKRQSLIDAWPTSCKFDATIPAVGVTAQVLTVGRLPEEATPHEHRQRQIAGVLRQIPKTPRLRARQLQIRHLDVLHADAPQHIVNPDRFHVMAPCRWRQKICVDTGGRRHDDRPFLQGCVGEGAMP
jgi:hypothetical protein